MTNYDEYQKYMRYKYDSHAFKFLLFLVFINFAMGTYTDFQWAETSGLEHLILSFIAVIYSVIMYIYHGAYFNKKQNGKLYAGLFFAIGLLSLITGFSPYSPIIVDGKITSNIIMPLNGAMFVLISVAYLLKIFVEKRNDVKEEEEN